MSYKQSVNHETFYSSKKYALYQFSNDTPLEKWSLFSVTIEKKISALFMSEIHFPYRRGIISSSNHDAFVIFSCFCIFQRKWIEKRLFNLKTWTNKRMVTFQQFFVCLSALNVRDVCASFYFECPKWTWMHWIHLSYQWNVRKKIHLTKYRQKRARWNYIRIISIFTGWITHRHKASLAACCLSCSVKYHH